VPPQPARVVVATVKRDPGKPPVIDPARAPLRHQGRLAESSRRTDQNQLGVAAGQLPDELLPLYPFPADGRRVKLRFDQYIQATLTGAEGTNLGNASFGLVTGLRGH
jgi:hypothetical protein